MQLSLAQLKGGLGDITPFKACLNGLGADKRFALAVSGGPDSLAMLLLFAQWRAEVGWLHSAGKGRDTILSVDHGLRAEAAAECEVVAKISEALGFAHQTLVWQHEGVETALQEKAREARYQLLDAAAQKAKVDYILLAHTQDDQAETVLMRLTRGGGVDGLAAMRRHKKRADLETPLLRPLLDVPKKALLDFLHANNLDYAKDPSNEDIAYERVRLRKFLNVMELNNPQIKTRVAATAHRMARAAEALEYYLRAFIQMHGKATGAGSYQFDLAAYRQLPREIRFRLIRWFMMRFGHGGMPSDQNLEIMEMVLAGNANTATLCGWQVRTTATHLKFEREIGRFPPEPMPLTDAQKTFVWDRRFKVSNVLGDGSQSLEAVGTRWTEVKALSGLEKGQALSALERAGLPCIVSQGKIISVPFFMPDADNAGMKVEQITLEERL